MEGKKGRELDLTNIDGSIRTGWKNTIHVPPIYCITKSKCPHVYLSLTQGPPHELSSVDPRRTSEHRLNLLL